MRVTLGKVVKIDGPVDLPKEFIKALISENKEKNAVIRVLPTRTTKSYKIIIHIADLAEDFIDSTVEVLSDAKAKLLYSSGVCFSEDEQNCYYECYIENPDEIMKIDNTVESIDIIKRDLSEISGVTNIDIELI